MFFCSPVAYRVRYIFRVTPLVAALLLAGCVTVKDGSPPIDKESPAYQAALEQKTADLVARGLSAAEAEKRAARVTPRIVKEQQAQERLAEAKPLVDAADAFDKTISGCWAFTVTFTHTTLEGKTETKLAQYNPSFSDKKSWTLVSIDGRPPTEDEQSDFRKEQKKYADRAAKRAQKRPSIKWKIIRDIRDGSLSKSVSAATGETTYLITQGESTAKMPGMVNAQIQPSTKIYVLDREGRLIRRSETSPGVSKISALAVMVRATIKDVSITKEFIYPVPELPPFVGRSEWEGEMSALVFGIPQSRKGRWETVYTDYRKVECYDDRFSVNIGPINVLESGPDLD